MKKIFFISILILIVFNFYFSYSSWLKTDRFRIFFFDVGQGDAVLIIAPGGKTILIDGGPDNKILRRLGEVLPFWQRTIDLLVITHAHDDHAIGLISVSRRYLIKQVVYNNLDSNTPTIKALTDSFKSKNLKIISAKDNSSFNFSNNCFLKILAAKKDVALDENDYSVVTSFSCLNKKILLTGDAGVLVEEFLLNKKEKLESDILKISHHGSLSASSENFLKMVNPNVAVISVGRNNKFKHPNLTILERLEKLSVDIYRTDEQGTIEFLANNNKIMLVK